MRWPIRQQVFVPFAAIVVIVVLAVGLSSAYLATRRAERRVEVLVRDLGRTLVNSSFPLTDAVLDQMHGLSGAHFVLVDKAGTAAAASQPAMRGFQPSIAAVNDWRLLTLGSPVRVGGEDYFASALRIEGRGPDRQIGVLHILYPESLWSDSRRQAALPPLMGGVVTLFVCMLASAIISGRISRPIARLRQQVLGLAKGDFATLDLPGRDDELMDLAGSVNVLAEQLREMRSAIRRTERLALLGQLSGALAHQLRNDLTGTRMAVQLHQKHCGGGDGESLAVALRQLEMTEQHLKRLLAAGQPQEPCRAGCDLEEIVEHVVALIEPTCRHRDLRLTFQPLKADKSESGEFRLYADEDQLRQLLMNLVVNAIEAAGAGGWVRIELERMEAMVALRVLDSGPGPPPEIAEQIFEEFITSKAEGVGLGLAVARRIAQSHAGALTYARRGGGTCFELRLPSPRKAQPPDASRGARAREVAAWPIC